MALLQGKNHTGAPGDFAPEMQKRALENQKRAPENCHRLQGKSLFNVAINLVNGMWKVAPENKNFHFWPALHAISVFDKVYKWSPEKMHFKASLSTAKLSENRQVAGFTTLNFPHILLYSNKR